MIHDLASNYQVHCDGGHRHPSVAEVMESMRRVETPTQKQIEVAELRAQTEKTCKVCNVLKPVADYYRDSHYKDGLMTFCKECHSARAKVSKEVARLKTEKQCTKCKVVKPMEQFFVDSNMKDGRKSMCRICAMQAQRDWRNATKLTRASK